MESEAPQNPTFADLGLNEGLAEALAKLGYEQPTPIQREAIPLLLEGKDMLGQAATGTGKTAAFALPIVDGIISRGEASGKAETTALVVVPTRELAMQVSEAITGYGKHDGIKVEAVYGGQPIFGQLKALQRGVHVVVGTPGRIIDHIKRRSLNLATIRTVVLDEADEMLDMGFTEDIEAILENTPDSRQTVLFSATMPPRINSIAKRHQTDPIRVQIKTSDSDAAKPNIRQSVYMVARKHKARALGRILDVESPVAAIVFCARRVDVDELTETMNSRGYRAEALHGGMDQQQRERVMGRLRDGTAQLLVATDVAARGLDVDTLTHVVNYDVPDQPESYVHRIGRVGRAGREGVAITLSEPRQNRRIQNIERLTKSKIPVEKVPTIADLQARQFEVTMKAVLESLASDDLEKYNAVLHDLAGQDSDRNIALAAIRLYHLERGAGTDTDEIPEAHESRGKSNYSKNDKYDKGRHQKGGSGGSGGYQGSRPRSGGSSSSGGATGLVYIGMGRKSGIRPGDLVGAIANEAGLAGSDIGPIRIADKYATVGVPEGDVDNVIRSIEATSIKGKKVKARRFVE